MRILFGLQYLRAVAAIMVVLFHNHALGSGRAGVDLFFVLSGFLMIAITGEQSRPTAFMADRIRRIVPAYWVATSVMAVGALAGLFPRVRLTFEHLATSYFFVPSFSPSNGQIWPLLVPGWTLNYEMAFYVLFALLMPIGSQVRQLSILTGLFAISVLCGILFHPTSAIGITYSDPILLEFAAGGWIGLLWKREVRLPAWLGWAAMALAIGLFASVQGLQDDRFRALAFGIPALLMVTGMLIVERHRPLPPIPGLLLLGNASYSIYLWHTLMASVTHKLAAKLALDPIIGSIVGIVCGIIVGVIAYLLIEKPILGYFKRRKTKTA